MYWLVKLCRKKDDMVNNNSTSRTKDSTSKTKDSRSKTKDSTSKTKDSTSRTKDSTSKTKDSTSKTKDSTSKTKDSTSKTKDSTSKFKDSTSKTKDSTPKTKTKTTTPKTKTNTSTLKTNTSIPKTNDKVHIEKHRSELHKTINNMKTILDCFVCEKFMNETFITRNLNKDGILLCSINNSMKGVKIINKIAIYRDLISLIREKYTKAMKQDITISIDDEKIILNTSQTDDYNGIQKN